jgi:3-oxoacyl-[acyl-carrier-protein] synthase-3
MTTSEEHTLRCTRDIFIASVATWLPDQAPVAPYAAQGLIDEMHRDLEYDSVTIADGIAAPDMAIRAARIAADRSGLPSDEFELLLHCSLWFQGLDMWGTASYVANESVGPQAVALDVQQRSCGGIGALHLATAYLTAGFAATAMITTGDNFAKPAFDRWNSQMYTLFGDGGTALALSTRKGFARVLASAAFADNSLEGWGRGAEPFGYAPGQEAPVQVLKRAAQHAATPAAADSWERIEAAMLKTRDQVLGDAGIDLGDISRAVLPYIHRGVGLRENYDTLGFTSEQSLWEHGRKIGHLGAGDQFAGLDYLIESKAVAPGDRVLMFGVGVGFSFAATIVEILEVPSL